MLKGLKTRAIVVDRDCDADAIVEAALWWEVFFWGGCLRGESLCERVEEIAFGLYVKYSIDGDAT